MSKQHAQQFIQKVQSDEALRAEILALGQDVAGVAALAARHSFSFSAADLQAAMQSDNGSPMQLGEADLESIAGGGGSGVTVWTGCSSGQSGCNATAYLCNSGRLTNVPSECS
jgi:predicted ribosomally synthesized peptide with nif11-like leader